MWFVIWTTTGSENKLNQWISEFLPHELYDNCFVPMVDKNMKVQGNWIIKKKALFPGYLFVNTDRDRVKEIALRLKKAEQFAVVLSTDGIFSAVSEDEAFIIDSAFDNEGTLGTSVGFIEGGKIKILSGPLIGKEAIIKSIDRHKRTAIIELNMFGRKSNVKIGLEIVSKS